MTTRYENYEDYLSHQKEKTSNEEKRQKWLGEEWDLKLDGFKKEFSKFQGYFETGDKKCLCIGARTGQEVAALKSLGAQDTVGIDLIPCEPHVIEGDAHSLQFEDETFDFVYTNVLNYAFDPKKMISEIERVLKKNGVLFLQASMGPVQDEYATLEIQNPAFDVVALFDQSYCLRMSFVNNEKTFNFAGSNLELVFRKDEKLSSLFKKYGNLQTIELPEKYSQLWDDINDPIQNNKLTNSNILDGEQRHKILNALKKRAYYLTRIAEVFDVKKIVEVGTAEGWQFFSFGEYATNHNGKVFSCDPRDVRNKKYVEEYKDVCFYHQNDSKYLSGLEEVQDIDMFYIDGLHDENTVINDLLNLIKTQNKANPPVWIFDDFDVRFGCYKDISKIINASNGFKVWDVGLTASGQPSHQVMINSGIYTE